ncbi:type VI secretion system Vgr family protein [Oceanospirillum sp.]|uniref:type VI secretion system Vgr family protein n=1 Tax=Oceanospirillum sp. TaxID=2021254 RepID=UPI003A91662D
MGLSSDVNFSFKCDNYADNEFRVLQFSGSELLGDLFQFDIQLINYSESLNAEDLLDGNCTLEIDSYGKKRSFKGILSNFNYLKATENGYLYQATLVPRLWLLTQFTTNEVYLGLTLSETLTLIFDEAGLTADEYDLSLISGYRKWDYRCQFGESHYTFLKRITEREGVYFYFDQKSQAVFCNKNNQHPQDSYQALYSTVTGNSYSDGMPVIFQWTKNIQRVPKEVIVKDYNNDQPSVDLSAKALIDSSGMGEVFRYCDNLLDLEEAKELADIRAEELLMQKTRFFGSSLDVEISPAHPIHLQGHPLGQLNIEYTPISVSHNGYAPDLSQIHQTHEQPYSNTIQSIAADTQFRPEQRTEKPRFYGVLNAIIDSEGDGQYAHLDSRGRYKVVLPFDRKGRDGAQASWWIPMSQPNAGDNSGMHFPLLKGAEVLLSFIGGDPDRPVITGAVPNASKPSIVQEDNHTQNKIKTAANNIIEMEDEAGSERIKLFSPNSNSYLHLGAANPVDANGIMMMTEGGFYQEVVSGSQITMTTRKKTDAIPEGLLNASDQANDLIDESTLDGDIFLKGDDNGKLSDKIGDERTGEYHFVRISGEQYTWTDGNTYTFGGSKDFNYGNGYEVSYVKTEGRTKWDGSFELDYFSIPGYDPDKLLIGKTIGDTYDYQAGNKEEVYFGLDEVSRGATLATTEVKATGVNTSASISALSFNFEAAGAKVDFNVAPITADIHFGHKFERSEASQDITGVQGVTVSSAVKVGLYASPLAGSASAPPTTDWAAAVKDSATILTKLSLSQQAIDDTNSGGSLELTPASAKLSATPATTLTMNPSALDLKTATNLSMEGTIQADLNGGRVNVKTTMGPLTVASANLLSLKAATTARLEGTAAAVITGGTVTTKAKTALTLQGATINMKSKALGTINGGGMLQVKAGAVQIG